MCRKNIDIFAPSARFGPRLGGFPRHRRALVNAGRERPFHCGDPSDGLKGRIRFFWRHVSSRRQQGRSGGTLLGAALLAMAPALLDVAPALVSMAPAVLALAPALLSGCAASTPHEPPKAAALPVLKRQDMLWLERVSFGIDSESVAELHRLGRERYLERQLEGRATLARAGRRRTRRARDRAPRSGCARSPMSMPSTRQSTPCPMGPTRTRPARR